MIRVEIGTSERTIENADPNWINEQISRRRRDGQAVCARVRIADSRANVILTTPACGPAGGGNRPPNAQESEIFALWD